MNLNVNLFITPLITLSLVLWGYFYFKKKVGNRSAYHKYLGWVGALSFLFNWGWEIAQGPLYEGFEFDLAHISFCGLASIADMLMVYILLFGFGLIYKDVYWIKKLTATRILWLVLAGFIGAILAEIRHTAAGNWSYAEAMPLLPIVQAGLSPVLQFAILPTLVFLLTAKFINSNTLETTNQKIV